MSFIDLSGKKFGFVNVLEYQGNLKWFCRCDCGKEFIAYGSNLKRGKTKSCGCYRTKLTIERHRTHDQTKTRLYHIWCSMKTRCYYPKNCNYKYYGLKGITVCPEWKNDFLAFASWAKENGYSEELTIDRIDTSKGYCPENCRWVDYVIQGRNKTNNRLIEYNGEKKTLSEWSEQLGIGHTTILYRLKAGWGIEDALSTPIGKRSKWNKNIRRIR